MRIVDFKREQGKKDVYEYFEFVAQNHELKYYNAVRTPEGAAFGFINSLAVRGVATDSDMQTYTRYLIYRFTLGSPEEANSLYEQFEKLLDASMPDVEGIYFTEDDRFIAVFNRIDTQIPPKKFIENYEMTLRNIVANAKA